MNRATHPRIIFNERFIHDTRKQYYSRIRTLCEDIVIKKSIILALLRITGSHLIRQEIHFTNNSFYRKPEKVKHTNFLYLSDINASKVRISRRTADRGESKFHQIGISSKL